jgi:transcriptional regulator with PAS, ATPase and Fis domain
LRALQERQIRRVGGTREINIDVRVVAATNRDLLKMSQDGRFREDLYYRLNVLSIEIPPLRERRADIPVLIDYFIGKHARKASQKIKGLSADARKLLLDYAYPGNVRQLESAIERAVLLAEGDTITIDDLPPEMLSNGRAAGVAVSSGEPNFKLPAAGINFEEVERSLILQAMERTDYNITKAARLLGLTFRTLQYRLDKFGIKRDGDGGEESEE